MTSAPASPAARAAAWLQAWDNQGEHRTGTDGDLAGAEWLAASARDLGAEAVIERFALDRLDPQLAELQVDGKTLPGVPVFDAPATDAAGIVGRLGPLGSGAEIAVAEVSPWVVYTPEYQAQRRTPGYLALAIICQGRAPGLALLNAEQFRRPYGAPAIHLSSELRDTLLAGASRGATARLIGHSRRTPTQAPNVVVNLPGRDPGRPPVVVMTPRSSWWQSTAERGGGLICWLETLRALLADPPGCPVVLTANSGHELGHLGLDDFVARRPGWDRPGGATWVHYGANLGAADGTLSIMANSDDLRTLAREALSQAGQPPDTMMPADHVPSGETRDIHRAGGRYVTLVGSNRLFHLPQDRWPDAVDLAAVTRIASASARLVLTLTR